MESDWEREVKYAEAGKELGEPPATSSSNANSEFATSKQFKATAEATTASGTVIAECEWPLHGHWVGAGKSPPLGASGPPGREVSCRPQHDFRWP